jgi:hypothetical protein
MLNTVRRRLVTAAFARAGTNSSSTLTRGTPNNNFLPSNNGLLSSRGGVVVSKSYATSATTTTTVPLISTAVGTQKTSLAECFAKLSQINAEIKESRQLRLGGKEVKMFLTVGASEADLKKCFESMEFTYVDVEKARDTTQDIKGPYCETSPLLPFVRRIQLRAPYTKSIEMKITDLMCRQGVTISHLDQYRSGKDIIMEGIAHMPTGVAEFPKLDETSFVQTLEKEGILVKEFSKIVGNPAPIGK